ncbi:MAG: GxxExxY protein [Myxococcales bacterium]|nr:GxxExxY protein [Myxococcales bacterium]
MRTAAFKRTAKARRREGVGVWADRWSAPVIGAAIEVHKALGPGLLESVYEFALEEELRVRAIPFERQKPVPIRYRDLVLDAGLRLDFVVGGQLIVELKSVTQLIDIHEAQLLTYMKLTGCPLGLLINFNVAILRRGIRRLVHHAPE